MQLEIIAQLKKVQIENTFSSKYHKYITYDGGRLFSLLQSKLNHLSEIDWSTRAKFGGIYMNGIIATEDIDLPTPACVEYYEPIYDLREAENFYPKFNKDWIVFEDNHFLVSFKPANLSTMPAKEQVHFNLRKYLDTYVGHAVHCPSRLDTSTQGLVIVSKDSRTHKDLQQLFEKKMIQKSYLLLSSNIPISTTWTCDLPIGKSYKHPVLRACYGESAKDAFTSFEKLNEIEFMDESNTKYRGSFILAKPKTGRTHQIRVHSSHMGYPIVGDKFYGTISYKNLCLLSYSLSFIHPIFNTLTNITAPTDLIPDWAKSALL